MSVTKGYPVPNIICGIAIITQSPPKDKTASTNLAHRLRFRDIRSVNTKMGADTKMISQIVKPNIMVPCTKPMTNDVINSVSNN